MLNIVSIVRRLCLTRFRSAIETNKPIGPIVLKLHESLNEILCDEEAASYRRRVGGDEVLKFTRVNKRYGSGDGVSFALRDVGLTLKRGDFFALVGPSGSGKTTLLNLAAGFDFPSEGDVAIAGRETRKMSKSDLCRFRSHQLGFVFQSFNLFPVLTAIENVEYTCLIRGDAKVGARADAQRALRDVGLQDKERSYPSELSGGQQQRVAVARALATRPSLILADEPTANLDSKTALQLIELFRKLNVEKKVTFLFSTHDTRLIEAVRGVVELRDGVIHAVRNQDPNEVPP